MERRVLLSTLVVTDPSDDPGVHSLRWAIEQANASGSTSPVVIDFAIAGNGPLTIPLTSVLPAINVPVKIDGTSEPGYQGTPLIEISGSGLTGSGNDGLVLTAGGSTITGLSLVGFSDSAIVLKTGSGNAISGNALGVTPSGSTTIANGRGITLLGSSFNTIGAGPAGAGNLISGNSGDGILLMPDHGTDSASNRIVGNRIGTTADGTRALGNGGAGVDIQGAGDNTIGLPGLSLGNVLSANSGPGIVVAGGAQGTEVQNNIIGLAADGRTPMGNQGDGIQLDGAPATVIGGEEPAERNIIAANRGNGISTSGNTAGLLVAGNAIGTAGTGTLQLGNQQNGVCLASSSNTIGGNTSDAANVIAYNGSGRVGAGVQLVGTVDQNSILSNSIVGNAGLGINFGSGPTPNHAPGTRGPNDYQNYPVLSFAQNDGSVTTVNGTLSQSPNTSYLIQFFTSPQPDPSGYGQGEKLLGSTSVETNANGLATIAVQLPPMATPGQFLSATATDPTGNTSEFSAVISVQGQINLVLTGTATPNPVAAGGPLTYTLTVTNQGTAAAHDVVLVDQLPSGVLLGSVTPSQGFIMPVTGGTGVTASLGTISAGSSATVTIVVQTGAGSIGTIIDTASVSSQEADPYPALESTTIQATVESATDLSITLTPSASSVLAGAPVTFTMTVTNNGPERATDVVAALPLAPGVVFVSAGSATGTAAYSGQLVVAQLGNLASGGSAVVTVVVQTTAAGTITETATVSSGSLDPNPSNNTASAAIQVDPASDLSVQLAADTAVAATGVSFGYTLTVSNGGPTDATGIVVTDLLPNGVTFVSVTTPAGVTATNAAGVITIEIPALASGTTAGFSIAVETTASTGATLVDSATVTGDQADPNPSNNAATLSLPVRGISDLAVVATVQPGPYHAGQPLTYTIQVTNNGPAAEPDAVLTSVLPPGLSLDATTATQGAGPTIEPGMISVDLGALASGQTATFTVTATPGPQLVGSMTTAFSVQGQDYDPTLSNNAASVTVSVAASSDLGVQIIPGQQIAVAQVNWSYTVLITNTGPSAATGVVATIPVPAGTVALSTVSSQGQGTAVVDGVITAALGTIAAGGSATVTVTIDPAATVGGGTIGLSAQVTGGNYDPDPSNDQSSMNVAVAPSVTIGLALISTPNVVASGQDVAFTASVRNLGTTPATGVIVMFPELNGLQFVGSSPSQGTPALVVGQFFARLGELAPGDTATVVVHEQAITAGTYAMTASVSQNEYNLDPLAASATASAQVLESPGTLQFGAASVQVTDQSGVAVVPVVRLYGASGTVTVHYQTTPIGAIPGLDFTPTSGTLTLAPGQSTGSIQVPILDDPYQNRDTALSLTLDTPTNGAALGPLTAAQVLIHVVDPNFTPPRVTHLGWSGSSRSITSLTLQFSAPLDPAYATNPADYHLVTVASGQPIPIASVGYDATQFAVTLVPQSPIPSGRYTQIQVAGTGPGAIRDIAGNLLDGAGAGIAGTTYVASFAQGNRLRYMDGGRNLVTLSLRGPGYLEQVLDANGNGLQLGLVGMVPHRTVLKGHLKARRGASGQTQLGVITGLGQFGNVRILLKSPPFRVAQLPFQRRGQFVL